jgi:hypothetical protein
MGQAPPPGMDLQRQGLTAQTQGVIGASGLRAFLSEAGFRGELTNRAASYRMARSLETARLSELHGRIGGIQEALAAPGLSPAARASIEDALREAEEQLAVEPGYSVDYTGVIIQSDLLEPVGFLLDRPLFVHAKATGFWRDDADGSLRVGTGRAEFSLLHTPSAKLFLGIGGFGGFTRADVDAFDGSNDTQALGARVFMGYVLGRRWLLGIQGEQNWAAGNLTLQRGSATGPVRVEQPVNSRGDYAQVELLGQYEAEQGGSLPTGLSLEPRFGAYLIHTAHEATLDNLGNASSGTFGSDDHLAVVRAAVDVSLALGSSRSWSVAGAVGLDHEVHSDMTALVTDPTGIELSLGVTRRMGRARRIMLSFEHYRGTKGLRRSWSLSLIAILDRDPRIPGPPR